MANATELTLTAVQLASPLGGLHSGYRISTEHNDGTTFTVVRLLREIAAQDTPSIVLKVHYDQRVKVQELNLDLRCTALADGTQVEVRSTDERFTVPSQPVQGNKVIGAIVGRVEGALSVDIELHVHDALLGAPVPEAAISLELSTIENPRAPVRKTILQKILLQFPR